MRTSDPSDPSDPSGLSRNCRVIAIGSAFSGCEDAGGPWTLKGFVRGQGNPAGISRCGRLASLQYLRWQFDHIEMRDDDVTVILIYDIIYSYSRARSVMNERDWGCFECFNSALFFSDVPAYLRCNIFRTSCTCWICFLVDHAALLLSHMYPVDPSCNLFQLAMA